MPKKKADPGYVSPGIQAPKGPDYVVVELRHDSRIAYSTTGFSGPAEVRRPTEELNKILSSFNVKRVTSHFAMKATDIRRRIDAAPPSLRQPVSGDFAKSGFVQVVPRRSKDAESLAKRLTGAKWVWKAVVAPRPVPAGAATDGLAASRNFEPAQGYLHSPPNGIGAMEAWSKYSRCMGRGITICDIEGNWNRTHEDLPKRIALLGGTLVTTAGWENHGTAVLGEMVSQPGATGTVGICHKARAVVHSAYINGVWNCAGAISNATQKLGAGDVILIELQAAGPNWKYVAMQYWDDVFSAIKVATQKGITVVEAAGNGDENFDLPIYNNTGLQKDSGAIVVGAGVPPTNHMDYFGRDWQPMFHSYSWIGVPRSRIWFSNYGKIVNVQAWGWHVTTTGYGDAQGGSPNRWYTHRFSGTSSASPIVTGCVAFIQSCAKVKYRRPLPPGAVRSILIKTGTPQVASPTAPLKQHIGPQPNLIKALGGLRKA
jgi:hypothetical protein